MVFSHGLTTSYRSNCDQSSQNFYSNFINENLFQIHDQIQYNCNPSSNIPENQQVNQENLILREVLLA